MSFVYIVFALDCWKENDLHVMSTDPSFVQVRMEVKAMVLQVTSYTERTTAQPPVFVDICDNSIVQEFVSTKDLFTEKLARCHS